MKPLRSCTALLCTIACVGCSSPEPIHQSYWQGTQAYEDLFDTTTAKKAKTINEPIAGAILPHHLFVGHELAAAYNALSGQEPSIVVVIGPNHFSKGHGMIQTTHGSFATPYGIVQPATETIDALVERGIATMQPETIDGEHAISTHVAFIEKIFPDATIVPLVVAIGAKDADVDTLAETLDALLPEDAIVIASVDFSHYMRPDVATFHDGYSRAVIERFALEHVARLEIDSPESIRTLLQYLTHRSARQIVYKEHTNSADFTGGMPQEETTSHFFMVFGQGEPLNSPFATVRFFGDTIVARGITEIIRKGIDPLGRIRGTEDRFFRGATVTIVNLEGPITDAKPSGTKPVAFAFDHDTTIGILREMGVNIASIANNHIDDAGVQGKHDTITALASANMIVSGFPEPCATVSIVNGTMAVCSFADMHGLLNIEAAAADIATLPRYVQYVVASVHWGIEYATEPSERQRQVAKALLDAGASAVVGHGPHVVQPLEWIDGKPVFYSIGNFLFDQPDPTLSSGIVAGVTLAPSGIGAIGFPIETTGGIPRHKK